jgi:glyoxylase-like metal-dependent hydrolase (beta-lactamase superfamily II)
MQTLTSGFSYVDLHFLNTPRVIATAILHGPGGVALIDPGPSSTLPTLRQSLERAGIRMSDVREILLTHIHLDHAGSTGTLVRDNPSLRVYVSQIGAPHLIDPSKLVASAARLYEDQMQRLWGDVLPVPESSITPLAGGERITAGGRALDVVHTPGHASHHVSYFDADAGLACVGDTAGIRLRDDGFILPPTPPPDVDLEAWRRSLAAIGDRRPETLFITHFGHYAPVASHLAELADHIELTAGLVKASLARDETDAVREVWFTEEIRTRLRRHANEADAHAYEVAGRFDLNWRGLARYWRKRT